MEAQENSFSPIRTGRDWQSLWWAHPIEGSHDYIGSGSSARNQLELMGGWSMEPRG